MEVPAAVLRELENSLLASKLFRSKRDAWKWNAIALFSVIILLLGIYLSCQDSSAYESAGTATMDMPPFVGPMF
jgi:hypothetical protein